ncbi:MAG: ParB/RepB/Spo0J family partition protein [Gammaproteobacteria bacterium]
MSAKKRGLGRGLDALLGTPAGPAAVVPTAVPAVPDRLPLDQLRPGRYQPRHGMDPEALESLAASIRAQGIVQPIVVRPLASGAGFEIIAGERRWRAARIAGLAEVPVIVRRIDDEAALSMALIENIQREDLNPLDEAHALQRLTAEFGMTHEQAAEAVGRSRAAVSNLLRLLELDPEVRTHLAERRLEMGHARALLPLDAPGQRSAAAAVVEQGLSVRATEALVRRMLAGPPAPPARTAPARDPDIERLQSDLADRIGARVEIRHARSGAGSLVVHYHSLDELDGILARIK